MVGRLASRSLAAVALVALSCIGIVYQSSPAHAEIVWGPSDRAVIKLLERQAAKGAAPAAIDAAGASIRFCKGSAVACAGITAATVGAALMLVGGRKYWVPWVENKMNEAIAEITGGEPTVTNKCASQVFNPADMPTMAANAAQGFVQFTITAESFVGNGDCLVQNNVTIQCQSPGGDTYPVEGAQGVGGTDVWVGHSTTLQAHCQDKPGVAWQSMKVLELTVKAAPYPGRGDGAKNGLHWKSSDPVTSATTQVHCKRPDGSEYQVSEPAAAVSQGMVQMPSCDEGDTVTGVGAEANGKPGTGWNIDLKPKPEDLTNYPQCATDGCVYRVLVDGDVCQEGMDACVDWTRTAKESPSRVECYYGPYKVATSYCYWLERAFEEVGNGTGTKYVDDPNTDGDPDTYSPPTPKPRPSPTTSPTPRPTVTAKPSPTVTPTPVAGYCASPYNLGAVLPQTARLANDLGPRFQIQDVGGYRESDPYPDHPSGKAADFMVYADHFKGERLAAYAQQNAASLGVDYIMWDHHIWSQTRSAEGWRPVADRGSPTANHEDHVHITVLDVAGAVPCGVDPGDSGGNSGECFPSGWGVFNPVGWVLQPIKCAFIPSDEAVETMRRSIDTDVKRTGVTDLTTAIRGPLTNIPDGGNSCLGPAISFPEALQRAGFPSTPLYPVSACEDPLKTAAGIVRALSTVVIVVGGGLTFVRFIAAGFGYNVAFRGGGAA